MVTKVVRGCPKEVIEKRINRINEALSIRFLDENNPVKYVVDVLPDTTEVLFYKPGKEYFRKKPNKNDMSPNVGNLFTKYAFADIWKLLCELKNTISDDNYKKLSVILYRVAYLLDYEMNADGKKDLLQVRSLWKISSVYNRKLQTKA